MSEIKDQVEQQMRLKLIKKAEILENMIQKVQERNEYLQSALDQPDINIHEPINFPFPNKEVLTAHIIAQRRNNLSKRKNERLHQANKKLVQRISKARTLLAEQKLRKSVKDLELLSPTAAEYHRKQIKQWKAYSPPGTANIETTALENQLKAVKDLQNGIKPNRLLPIRFNFDLAIEQAKSELDYLQEANKSRFNQLSKRIDQYMNDTRLLNQYSQQRVELTDHFTELVSKYHNVTYEIAQFPYKKALQIMQSTSHNNEKTRLNQMIGSLEEEKELLQGQLIYSGAGDEETVSLKTELEISLLYLSHLTAIAGKTLCRMSTNKEPLDPIENMEADIIEMEFAKKI